MDLLSSPDATHRKRRTEWQVWKKRARQRMGMDISLNSMWWHSYSLVNYRKTRLSIDIWLVWQQRRWAMWRLLLLIISTWHHTEMTAYNKERVDCNRNCTQPLPDKSNISVCRNILYDHLIWTNTIHQIRINLLTNYDSSYNRSYVWYLTGTY